MIKLKAITFLMIIALSFSCQKNEIKPVNTEQAIYPNSNAYTGYIDTALYPYLFEKESYWVYQDLNGVIDSVILRSVTEHKFLVMKYNYEWGLEMIKESTRDGVYKEFALGRLITAGWTHAGYRFYHTETANLIENLEIVEIVDEMEIAGNVYKNVTKILIKPDDYTPREIILYYAPYVGIIRKENTIDRETENVWELIQYNVNTYEF